MPVIDIKKEKLIAIFPEFSPMRLKYKDIFDMKEFYDALREWLKQHEWQSHEGDLEWWETYYDERIGQGGGKEIFIKWRVKKNAPDAATLDGQPSIVFYMDLDFHCLNLKPTEVVKEGKKIKAHKGEVELHIRAFIDPVFLKLFKKHFFLRQVVDLFKRRIYGQQIEERKKELYQECYVFNNFIKQWFKLKRYLPYEETKNFYPSYAYPSHLK